MSHARIIVAGATTAVTKRTNMRKAFLAPWHPLVDQIWLYAMAHGQQRTGVAIHHAVRPITHEHLLVTPSKANLPDFVGGFHNELSRALNTLLARERYDAPRELFDSRDPHYMRLMDAPAQATQAVYHHNNCVAAGLVARPEHMPGQLFDFDLWKTRYIEVRRPDVFFGEGRPEVLQLEVTPPPLLYELFGGDLDSLIAHMKGLAERSARALRAKQKRAPLGAQRIQRIHPWSEPRTLRESGGKRVPSFRYGAGGIAGQQRDIKGAREVGAFRRNHHGVRVARRDGDLSRRYPFGTYKERVVHAAPVEPEPGPGDAFIAAPGPLLADIEARLEAELPDRQVVTATVTGLMTAATDALTEEAEELCEHAGDDVGEFRADPKTRKAGQQSGRNAVAVRHRFDRDQPTAASGVKRIVTLRDRRRGRPPRTPGGADPPG